MSERFHEFVKKESVYKSTNVVDNNLPNYAILYIYAEDEELHKKYQDLSSSHNEKLVDSKFPDSGVDIYTPDDVIFKTHFQTKMINMNIKTKMVYYDTIKHTITDTGFYMYPRSSLSKTELMLANHTGIIDSGYRGDIMGAFRWLPCNSGLDNYTVLKDTRLLQICHPTLCPVYIVVTNELKDIGTTERGEGGFGSSGK